MVYLRGKKTRQEFVATHDLKPISYQKLLKGQTKESAGGTELTDRYYCFLYNRKGIDEQKTFICGYHIAKDLLRLTGQEELPLFNPLKAVARKSNNQPEKDNVNKASRQWNDVARQLSDAINLFIAYWDKPIYGVLAAIHFEINAKYYKRPKDSKIKSVNTCLYRIINEKTLKDIEQELSKENDIKNCDFSLLNEILKRNNIKSSFG
ncbi:hypothetical protein [Staphylococcus simulans]|uniref:hypothetical protein n=1 Tax=Staphylococcus simulans TaxID=1286 RepID=UPI0021D29B86|nr:hypothetical protein [Staphylococcus simulans]UXV38746.1 hypothetical protein MUA87_12635 [Staphylococcus simulans]UXV41226.1 hypothetical protein MUA56_12515 [Staphylococcus simulans]